MRPSVRLVQCLAVAVALAGCGTGFDPPSEVKSLRVLGVQKDDPYPQPNDTVTLKMLWHDGLMDPLRPEETQRDVQVSWLVGCRNPPTENFYGCFPQFAGDGGETPNLEVQVGDTAQVDIGDVLADAVEPRPGQPVIGRTFVFFSVCAGTVGLEPPTEEGALPFVCRDAQGALVGPDSFVVGYTSLLTYAEPNEDRTPIRNANPIVTGFQVEGVDVQSFCTDDDCLEPPSVDEPDIDCASEEDAHLCFRACADDGDPDCPEIRIKPLVDRASAELDEAARTFFGRDYLEQMWINYYVDRGSVKGAGVRLLNDATTGWNDDYGTEFYAPKEPGPVTIWAVIHDDRGGQSWIRTRIMITEEDAP